MSYFNEIQRLSSAYNTLLWHTSYIDVTFWSFLNVLHCCQFSLHFVFLYSYFLLALPFYCVFLHVLPSGVIKSG